MTMAASGRTPSLCHRECGSARTADFLGQIRQSSRMGGAKRSRSGDEPAVVRALHTARSMKHLIIPGVTLLAACVAPSQEPEPGLEQVAQQRDAVHIAATAVAIQTDVPPALVIYREGAAGPWQSAPRLKATTYEIQVNGPYTVMVVCTSDFGTFTYLNSLTLQDTPLVQVFCEFSQEEPYVVNGLMVQSGSVTLGDMQIFDQGPNWPFSFPVFPGRHDLLAFTSDRALIQRAIPVTGDVTLPPIDLAQQGVSLVSAPIAVSNPFPGEELSARTYVITPRIFQSQLYRGPFPAKVMPSSALLPYERQEISLRSTVNQEFLFTSRSYRTAVRSGETLHATLWAPFTGLSLGNDAHGDVKASWDSSLPIDYGYLNASDFLGNYMEHFASTSYLTATGSHQVVLDTQVPGFQPAWRIDLSMYNRSFSVIQDGIVRQGYQRDDFELSSAASTAGSRGSRAEKAAQLKRMRQVAETRRSRLIQE